MNAEIVRRLEWSLPMMGEPVSSPSIPNVSGDIPYVMAQDIARLALEANVSFEQMLARIFVAGMHPDAPQILYMPVLPGANRHDIRATMDAMSGYMQPNASLVSEMVTRWSGLTDVLAAAQPIEKPKHPARAKPK